MSVMTVSHAKMAKKIEMPFGGGADSHELKEPCTYYYYYCIRLTAFFPGQPG